MVKDLSFEQGATALMRKGGHRAYVQTGAAGQLGRMLLSAASEQGLVGVHVVRRAEQAESLRASGAQHVLVSSDSNFQDALAARCRELGATIALDAVAGSMTGQLVAALPKYSEVVVYGALSGEPCAAIDPMTLAFGHKQVRGFEIAAYLREIGLFGSFRLGTAAQKRVAAGQAVTQVRARLTFAEAPAGLAQYVRAMSEGKVLLVSRVEATR